MISLTEVRKAYVEGGRRHEVLRGITLEVAAGELVALVGSSGSGKTTLLNVIGALDGDYSGRVVVAGQELRLLSDVERSRFRNRTVGFVFQQFHLLPHLPVADNVAMPSWFDPGRSGADQRRQVLDVLERVDMAHKASANPNHLSGGEKQRVAIARALFNRPRLLLCDEPTGALDSVTGRRVMEVIEELSRRDGLTVLVVTHEVDVARRAGRTISIRDGRICDGGVDQVAVAAAAAPSGAPAGEGA